jgi:hypothetical protein
MPCQVLNSYNSPMITQPWTRKWRSEYLSRRLECSQINILQNMAHNYINGEHNYGLSGLLTTTIIHITKSSFPSILLKKQMSVLYQNRSGWLNSYKAITWHFQMYGEIYSIFNSQPITTENLYWPQVRKPSISDKLSHITHLTYNFFSTKLLYTWNCCQLYIYPELSWHLRQIQKTKVITHQHSKPSQTENTLT